ncbi:protein-lysine methyltransferase METTL21C-like isoform X2 [Nerophis ophidion]|nr:protein-lysine methyltransferase METTL21C-like isoform X2 [Nerophis ophidion]
MKQEEEEEKEKKDVCERRPGWTPCFFQRADREKYFYVGHDIVVQEALDSYAAMTWPAALALCDYLDSNQQRVSLQDKMVLEIGAGTGLLSIVASLLGAWVTATDLPEVLGNLRFNLSKNTRGRCRHPPQVAPLSWGEELERSYPASIQHYDYILASDVVYHHHFLDQLLATMKHFCQPGTSLIWANKVRVQSDLVFVDSFQKTFQTELLVEDGEMRIFMATCRGEGPARGGRRLP